MSDIESQPEPVGPDMLAEIFARLDSLTEEVKELREEVDGKFDKPNLSLYRR